MFEKPEQLGRALIKIDTYPSIAVKRNKFSFIVQEFPLETSFIFSTSYRFSGCVVPSPVKSTAPKTTEGWEVILGNVLFYLHRKDNYSLNKYYLTLPYTWQVIVYYCVNKTIRTSIGASKYLESLKELYTEEALIALVVLPETISEAFEVQHIKKNKTETITAPIELLCGLKRQNMNRIFYLLNYGNKVISNNTSSASRANVVNTIGAGRYGVLFTENRKGGYKYKKIQDIIAIGSVEDILNAYKGNTTENLNIKLKSLGVFNSIQEVAEEIKGLKNTQHLLMKTKSGFHTVRLLNEVKTAKVLDYITLKNFKPIGVKIELDEEVHNVYFNVQGTSLVNGIRNKYIRVSVKSFNNKVVRAVFNSVVKDGEVKQCVCCGNYSNRTSKVGLCLQCSINFRRRLSTGEVLPFTYSGSEFLLDVWNYSIVGDGKQVSFNCNSGQMILPLG